MTNQPILRVINVETLAKDEVQIDVQHGSTSCNYINFQYFGLISRDNITWTWIDDNLIDFF